MEPRDPNVELKNREPSPREFGKMQLRVRDCNMDSLQELADDTRERLLVPLVRLLREGYSTACPLLPLLHIVYKVQDCAQSIGIVPKVSTSNKDPGLQEMLPLVLLSDGKAVTVSSLRTRKPLLSVRRACSELLNKPNDAAKVNISCQT